MVPSLINKMGFVRGHLTLRNPICCIFLPLCAISQGFSVPYQFLFQEQVELDAVLRTEIMGKGTCLDSSQWLPSMTLFSVSNLVCIRLSIFILCNGWVIILLKIYKPAFLLIKYPCSTRDLGSCVVLSFSFSLSLWLIHWSIETCRAHFPAWAFKTSLRGHPVPPWVVQALS